MKNSSVGYLILVMIIDMNDKNRIDLINLHIHLGKKQGFDVSYLVELRQQRYLKSWDLYQ